MPVGQGARNNIILGGLGRPQLFDTNIKATSIDEDIFSDQTEVTGVEGADLVLVLDTSETPDKIKFITHTNLTSGFPVLTGSTNNTVVTVTGSETIAGEANLLFDGTILTNDGGEVDIDISSGDPHLSFQIAGTDKFTLGVDDNDSDKFKIDTGGAVGGATKLTLDSSGNLTVAGDLTISGDDITMGTNTSGAVLVADGTNYNPVAVSGDVTLASSGAITIANNAVESGMLNANVISGQTEITSGLADADELLYSDAGVIKRVGLDTLTSHIQSGIEGDITGVTAGVGLSGGGTSGAVTLTLDLSELSAVTPTSGDSFSTLDNDGAVEQRTTTDALATLFSGTGLTASSAVIGVDASQAITALTGGDLTIYDDSNNADVSFKMGTGANESLTIQVLNGGANKTAEEVRFSTATASGTANHGKIVFDIDGTDQFEINDSGVAVTGDLTITGDDLFMNTNTAGHILVGDDTNYNPVAVSGDITLASNGAVTIAAGAVEHGMLADDIVSGQAEITSGFAAADELMYSDGGTIKRVGLDTLATKLFSVASAGTVAQASDHMVLLDGGATGDVIIESIDDFLTAIAGANISVSSSQLAVASASATAADDIAEGDGAVNLVTTSGNITIDAQANDADVIIKVDDNGSAVTAVTFDGSAEGNAIFVNDIQLKSDSAVLALGTDLDATLTHDGTTGLTIAANPFEVDSGGNITLDAHTGIFIFQDANTEILRLTESGSGDVTVKLETNAKDLIFTDNGDAEGFRVLDGAGGVRVAGGLNLASASVAPVDTAHNAAGTAASISAGNTTAGTTNNIAGGSLTIQGGQGKGSGAGGDIIFKTANAGGSGSTLNSLATALTISDDLNSTFADNVLLGSDSAVLSLGADADATLTHDGTTGLTIAANPFEVDSGGNITLDAHTGVWIFQDANTEVLRITESGSGDVTVKLETNAKDLIFTDNGDAEGFRILDAAAGVTVAGKTTTNTIELGHASDTTIARSGSGAITVEGTQVLLAGAQTGVTTILNAGTKIGRDSQNLIDFATTDNKIIFRVNNVNEVELIADTLSPVTSDGVALGTGSLMWSDLFLASGSVVNFNNGDVTLTHSSETLTVGGGTLATAALTTSTIVASGIVKTDDTTNATSTTDGSLQTDGGLSVALDGIFGDDVTLITDDAVLNLGVGSDVKLTHDGTTGGTLSGTPMTVDSLGASALANDTFTGMVFGFISNEAIAIGNAVYIHTTDGRIGVADANALATMPAIGVAVSATGSAGNAVKVLTHGIYNDSDGFGGDLTEGVTMYLGETTGAVTATIPDADGDFVQVMGVACGPRDVFINPSLDIIERA